MKREYLVTCNVSRQKLGSGEWGSCTQIPFFILDADVQGITSADEAMKIVSRIVNPFCFPGIEISADIRYCEYEEKETV